MIKTDLLVFKSGDEVISMDKKTGDMRDILSQGVLVDLPAEYIPEEDVDFTCVMCTESKERKNIAVVLPCRHEHHLPCLWSWSKKRREAILFSQLAQREFSSPQVFTCITCRAVITHVLYNYSAGRKSHLTWTATEGNYFHEDVSCIV